MKFFCILFFGFFPALWLKAQECPDITERNTGQEIALRLFRSLGRSGRCPKVIYTKIENFAVVYDDKIGIDTANVIRKLTVFGDKSDDALAVIIGHEIWHYYQRQQNYFYGCWEDSVKQRVELEADRYGLMLAYFAGYHDAIGIYQQVFDVLQLPASACYPSSGLRKVNDRVIVEWAIATANVYDAGHIFLSNGSTPFCDMAISCYRHCGEKMLYLKEINYQIGLAFLMKGLNETGRNRYWLPLPFQQSPYISIAAKNQEQYGMMLLDSAKYYFNLALQQDPDFSDASFGELCASVFREPYDADIVFAGRESIRERIDAGRLSLLKATAALYNEETLADAKQQLDLLTLKKDRIADYARANLALEKQYKNPDLKFPALKEEDHVQHVVHKNPDMFEEEAPLLPENVMHYSSRRLDHSDLFSWSDNTDRKCILQTYHHFPLKKYPSSGINPEEQPGRKWLYLGGDDYDVLIRPKEGAPGELECIKVIHNIKK